MFLKTPFFQKVFYIFLSLCIIVGLNAGQVNAAHAQDVAPDKISFSQIYSGVRTLRGPQDSTSMGFRLPAHWSMPTGGKVDMSYSIMLFGSGSADTTNRFFKSVVQISLNNVILGTQAVDNEQPQIASFDIPAEAWQAVNPDGINDITVQLTTNDECGGASVLTIDSNSILTIQHDVASPATDLNALPWPLYQNTFFPDATTMVMPDHPTPGELKAALTVAAGLGRLTAGKLKLTTVTSSTLTDTVQNTSNLVFVGKQDSFPQMRDVTWPGKPAEAQPDDGLLQMVVSPWNQAKVVLWISGTSDTAIVKASQALASGEIRPTANSSVALVADIHPLPNPDATTIDSTLEKLGYGEEFRQGNGAHSIDYVFTIPYSQSASDDGALNLVYANSAILDFSRSGLSVSVNDQFVGSIRFTERSTNVNSATIVIPKGTILPGQNKISILETFKFSDICARPSDSDLWAVVRPESSLHIPLGPATGSLNSLNLKTYPEVFSPTLSTLAFVVSPTEPSSWAIASDFAYDLGQKTQGKLIDLDVAFADNIPESTRNQRNLFFIGQPTDLPMLAELSSNMPAPFPPGSNVAVEPQSELTFRQSTSTPSGYLEMFPSPWKPDRIVLTLLGNSEKGLLSARAALLTPTLRSKLTGNLAVIYGSNIYATNVDVQATPQPETMVISPPATPPSDDANSTGLSNSNLVLIGVIALIVFIFATIFIFMQRRRTLRKQ